MLPGLFLRLFRAWEGLFDAHATHECNQTLVRQAAKNLAANTPTLTERPGTLEEVQRMESRTAM
jgi:hypothetical protein